MWSTRGPWHVVWILRPKLQINRQCLPSKLLLSSCLSESWLLLLQKFPPQKLYYHISEKETGQPQKNSRGSQACANKNIIWDPLVSQGTLVVKNNLSQKHWNPILMWTVYKRVQCNIEYYTSAFNLVMNIFNQGWQFCSSIFPDTTTTAGDRDERDGETTEV